MERPVFSSKRWQDILYMEQLVAGTTYFLRYVLALCSLYGAACCWKGLVSPQALALHFLYRASCCWKDLPSPANVGTMFSTWSNVLLEGSAFSASVGATFSTWSGLLLERPAFCSRHWHNIPYMEQLVAGTTRFLQQALALYS